MSKRNNHLEAILAEIGRVGGEIDEVDDQRKHLVVYWSCAGQKLIQVACRSSRSVSGQRNAVSDIRRHARHA